MSKKESQPVKVTNQPIKEKKIKTRQDYIADWVKDAEKKGYSSNDIKKILIRSGYKEEHINEVLEVHNRITKTPKIDSSEKPIGYRGITTSIRVDMPKSRSKANVVQQYRLEIDQARVDIQIEKQETGYTYNLYIPSIDVATEALLDEIRRELISVTTIGAGEIVDQKSITQMKDKFMEDASGLLKEKIPSIAKETEEFLIGMLMQEMLGLGKIEFLINDPGLEEIVIIGSKEPTRVYHKKFGWLSTNIFLKTEDDITNYANIIARRIGRQISVLNPLLDAHVITGDRANAVLYPISTKGNTITIRKFARDPWTIVDLIENKTVGKTMAALLWLAIEYEMNVLISGGTASGKTVFLNACMPFIPPNHRIISIEDTRELMLPEFLYWCPLVTRTANPEGKGEISMLHLLVNSLRMRPDRIVLGEMRRQPEAEVLFEAMHTGHSVYATVHADTANETIRRLTNPPISIPPSMLNSVNLNVVMFRDRRRGFRRAFQLAEFIPGREGAVANILHRWVPDRDEFVVHNKSMAFFDELSRNTGMSQAEINMNLKQKKEIFDWLIKNKIRNLESIGKVMNLYYTNKEKLLSIIRSNQVEAILIIPKQKGVLMKKEVPKKETLTKKPLEIKTNKPQEIPKTEKRVK
ncbi:MAG: ATPase, T2SS/T4P/T4SS family [archaeon]